MASLDRKESNSTKSSVKSTGKRSSNVSMSEGDGQLISSTPGNTQPQVNTGVRSALMSNVNGPSNVNGRSDAGKRRRCSSGGTFDIVNTQSQPVSKDSFIKMSTDDKLVIMFDMLSGVTSLSQRVTNAEHSVQQVKVTTRELEDRVTVLEYKSIDNEARNRRNNLLFRGLPELDRDEDCESIIKMFLREKQVNDVYIQRAHRTPPTRNKSNRAKTNQTPRPITVLFRDYNTLENILSNAYKLKGTPYGINRDYPPEIVEARSRIWPMFKKAKAENPKGSVHIGFPAKLVVRGITIKDEFPNWRQVMRTLRKTRSLHSIDPETVPTSDMTTSKATTGDVTTPKTIITFNQFEVLAESDSESDVSQDDMVLGAVGDDEPLDEYSRAMSQMQSQLDKRAQERAQEQQEADPTPIRTDIQTHM